MGYLLEYLDREEFKVMLEKEYTMADYIESLKEDIRQQEREHAKEEGIKNLIVSYKEDDFKRDKIAIKIIKLYNVPSDKAEEYLRKYFD